MEESNNSSSFEEKMQNRKASLKKALYRHFRLARIHQKNKNCSRYKLLSRAAAIARANSVEGFDVFSQSTREGNIEAVRFKVVVILEDLEQVLELMRNNNNNNNTANENTYHNDNETDIDGDDEEDEEALLSMEERLNQWHKNQRRYNSWSPTLQTIPEEILAA